MANLKAHGFEVARIVRQMPDSDNFNRCRVEYSFRSDGHVLRRFVQYHKPDSLYPEGKLWDAGWKLYQRFKNRAVTVAEIKTTAEKFAERSHVAHGQTVNAKFSDGKTLDFEV